jgi:hypothetical protein
MQKVKKGKRRVAKVERLLRIGESKHYLIVLERV